MQIIQMQFFIGMSKLQFEDSFVNANFKYKKLLQHGLKPPNVICIIKIGQEQEEITQGHTQERDFGGRTPPFLQIKATLLMTDIVT